MLWHSPAFSAFMLVTFLVPWTLQMRLYLSHLKIVANTLNKPLSKKIVITQTVLTCLYYDWAIIFK